jgi:methionyl-tRNA formyltransferase
LTEPLDVLIVCDELSQGLRIRREVGTSANHQLRILAANAAHRTPRQFIVTQLSSVVRHPVEVLGCIARRQLQLSIRSLEDPRLIRRVHADVGLHAAGTIYRKSFLERFNIGLLNAHIGILPRYRGRSVMEWSLLHEDPLGVTVFVIDEGIDTGDIVHRFEVKLPAYCTDVPTAKKYLFSLDGAAYRAAIEQLAQPSFTPTKQTMESGVRFFVMSALLTNRVHELLMVRQAPKDLAEPRDRKPMARPDPTALVRKQDRPRRLP